jgi:hypothetical protein
MRARGTARSVKRYTRGGRLVPARLVDLARSWGIDVAGRSVRPNRRKGGMEYRVLWIDAQ